jgi:hypothetical protein
MEEPTVNLMEQAVEEEVEAVILLDPQFLQARQEHQVSSKSHNTFYLNQSEIIKFILSTK